MSEKERNDKLVGGALRYALERMTDEELRLLAHAIAQEKIRARLVRGDCFEAKAPTTTRD